VDESGAPTCLGGFPDLAFSLQLQKDFQPTWLPRLTPFPGSLPAWIRLTRFYQYFFDKLGLIMPQKLEQVNAI